ncbi:MAG: hypothetical protein JW841_03360 [Deltaproteobacteria bacterium]|nr:hypothetical protein [Deltaproteobacteria bacterium]
MAIVFALICLLSGENSFANITKQATPLIFRGNIVLNNEVYLAALNLPDDFAVNDISAKLVREKLLTFLQRAGYEIARVETAVVNNKIVIDIDEGRIQKLVLKGKGSLQTVRLLLGINLPQNVFNRPYLERQLEMLSDKLDAKVERFELVPVSNVQHVGPQVDSLGPLVDELGNYIGRPLLPPSADYELHIYFKQRDWSNGLGLSINLSGLNGIKAGLTYRNQDALMSNDRWFVDSYIESRTRSRIEDNTTYLAIEGAKLGLGWMTPPIIGALRPMLALTGIHISRQRPDIGLESYHHTRAQLAVALHYDFAAGVAADIGIGAERRDIFAINKVSQLYVPQNIATSSETLPFASATANFIFDIDNIRRDRHHLLKLTSRYYPAMTNASWAVANLAYQKVFALGWHDIWITCRAKSLFGKAPFVEEQEIGGSYVRGVFSSLHYARHAATTGLEMRFSLTRDVYKIGFFADYAVFGEINRQNDHETTRGMGAVGPSFHMLIADAFQLDVYYAIGMIRSVGGLEYDRGIMANLHQSF